MNESEANEMKEQIFAQLDEFDEYVAFRFSFNCQLVTNIYLSIFFQQPTFYNTTSLWAMH